MLPPFFAKFSALWGAVTGINSREDAESGAWEMVHESGAKSCIGTANGRASERSTVAHTMMAMTSDWTIRKGWMTTMLTTRIPSIPSHAAIVGNRSASMRKSVRIAGTMFRGRMSQAEVALGRDLRCGAFGRDFRVLGADETAALRLWETKKPTVQARRAFWCHLTGNRASIEGQIPKQCGRFLDQVVIAVSSDIEAGDFKAEFLEEAIGRKIVRAAFSR